MKKNVNIHTISKILKFKFSNVTDVELSKKESIIVRLIHKLPLPYIAVEELQDSNFVLTGGEVITAIIDYIHGRFEVEGKNFLDLEEPEQEKFFEECFVLYSYRGLSESDKALLKTLEKPVFLEKKEETLAVTTTSSSESKIEKELEDLLNHDFFKAVNISGVTNDILIQFFMVDENGASGDLSAKRILECKNKLEVIPKELTKTLDYMSKAFGSEKVTYLRKAHLPMIYISAQKAIESKVKAEHFRNIIDNFFASNNEEYKKAGEAHTSAKSNVNIRLNIMLKYVLEKINS